MGEYTDPGIPLPGVSDSMETDGSILQSQVGQQGPTLENLQQQVTALSSQLQQVLTLLQKAPALQQPNPVPPAPAPTPAPTATTAPTIVPTPSDFSSITVKELAKQSLNLADKQRLSGPENYQQWFQAISI